MDSLSRGCMVIDLLQRMESLGFNLIVACQYDSLLLCLPFIYLFIYLSFVIPPLN